MTVNDEPVDFLGRDRLPIGLLLLRIALAAYTAQWGYLQLTFTEAAADVYQRWYGFAPAALSLKILGSILCISAVLMLVGFGRRVASGIALLFQVSMVAGLIPHLLDPYGFHQPPSWINHGLIAQVTALAGYAALFVLRDADTIGFYPGNTSRMLRGTNSAARALLFIRLAAALFFAQWGIEKFVMSEMSTGIMERWYGIARGQEVVVIIAGIAEIALALAIALGLYRRITYGVAVLVKAKTCWAIAPLLLFPFATETGGRLSTVAASVPTLAALWFLYWARAWDTISLDSYRRRDEPRS